MGGVGGPLQLLLAIYLNCLSSLHRNRSPMVPRQEPTPDRLCLATTSRRIFLDDPCLLPSPVCLCALVCSGMKLSRPATQLQRGGALCLQAMAQSLVGCVQRCSFIVQRPLPSTWRLEVVSSHPQFGQSRG